MQPNRFIQVLFIVLLNLFVMSVQAQTYAGAGFGTFHIPGAVNKFRGSGPTIKLEQSGGNGHINAYMDLSYFTTKQSDGFVSVYDNSGNEVGKADAVTKYSYLYSQIGLKLIFFKETSERKLLPYLGGGVALVRAGTATSYKSNVGPLDDDKLNRFIFGFHFNAGLQYNLQPVILELRGNFDIDIKPLVPGSDHSNILTNLRLSALIPLTK